jgi:hypothetical protein
VLAAKREMSVRQRGLFGRLHGKSDQEVASLKLARRRLFKGLLTRNVRALFTARDFCGLSLPFYYKNESTFSIVKCFIYNHFYNSRPAGLEPATHGLEIRCSIRLS